MILLHFLIDAAELDPYSERDARLHVDRVRELLDASSSYSSMMGELSSVSLLPYLAHKPEVDCKPFEKRIGWFSI